MPPVRIDGSSGVSGVLNMDGLSAADKAQLILWTQNSRGTDLDQLVQQLGMNRDSFATGPRVDAQIASQGRNLDVYTAGPGLDAVRNGATLHIGHKGQGVRELQQQLNAMGANLKVDGYFGPKTEAALRSYQGTQDGMATNGVVDSNVLSRLGTPNQQQLTSEQWGRYEPDYTRDRGTAAADRERVLESRRADAKPLDLTPSTGTKGLLDQIAAGEGTSDAKAQSRGFESGYDVTLGYGAYTPDRFKGRKLSEMTLGEVKELQRGMLNNPRNGWNSSAVGRYQIVGTTLRGLQRQMGLSDDTVFSPQVQDQMATQLLEQRGLSRYQSGQISASTFQNNLSKEWASVARADTGRSHYGQGTGTSTAQIQNAIAGLNT